jgi:hypothetical protein
MMWSFGSKREDPVQDQQQQQQQQTTSSTNRSNGGDPGADQQQSEKSGGALAAKSRMFYKNKKLTSSGHNASSSNTKSSSSNPKPHTGMSPRTPQQKKRIFGGGGSSSNRRKSVSNSGDEFIPDVSVSVNETSNGIEVSFPGSDNASGSKGKSGKSRLSVQTPVISLKEQILERQRVFNGRFSTVLPASNDNVFSTTTANKWKPKGHRIPLLGITSADAAYSDALHMLKTIPIVDERAAVQQELNLLDTEIFSLQHDRIWLEQGLETTTSSNSGKTNRGSDSSSNSSSLMNKENIAVTWDTHKLLKDDASKKQPLSVSERSALQKQRGNSMTIHLSNNRTQEIFVSKFGSKQHNSRSTCLFKNDASITTIVPNNSSSSADTGTTTLQHVSLISPTSSSSSSRSSGNSGLYFSQDAGESANIGQLPNKLSQRFVDEIEMADEGRPGIQDLAYLSTGSRGCYFAKFQSGECWWGSAVEDANFQHIMNAWDVYRVAFGPIKNIELGPPGQQNSKGNNSNTKSAPTNSWIILSHDGKAAWKNLPSRLSNKLERGLANAAAPVEVSLGPGDSYFVRFLDGSIEYSLPSKIARVCERIEERGGNITNISLHPDICHDFVIRHTELTR